MVPRTRAMRILTLAAESPMHLSRSLFTLLAAVSLWAPVAGAQAAERTVLTLDGAKAIAAAAESEAIQNNWQVVIAIVDAHGELIYLQKADNVQQGSLDIAIAKARTAARMRRPTKALQDAVEGGRTVIMAMPGVLPLEGGVPVTVDGRVIGAVGVSGVTSAQDAQIATAGIRAVFPQ
jgi:glc operon protein GlcG